MLNWVEECHRKLNNKWKKAKVTQWLTYLSCSHSMKHVWAFWLSGQKCAESYSTTINVNVRQGIGNWTSSCKTGIKMIRIKPKAVFLCERSPTIRQCWLSCLKTRYFMSKKVRILKTHKINVNNLIFFVLKLFFSAPNKNII